MGYSPWVVKSRTQLSTQSMILGKGSLGVWGRSPSEEFWPWDILQAQQVSGWPPLFLPLLPHHSTKIRASSQREEDMRSEE